jgi:phage portal protein BeeE
MSGHQFFDSDGAELSGYPEWALACGVHLMLYGNTFMMMSRMADGTIVHRLIAPESVEVEDGRRTMRLP